MEQENWGAGVNDQPVDAITVQELEALCAKARDQRDEYKALEDEFEAKKKEFNITMSEIHTHLEKIGKDKYQSESGTFYVKTDFSVQVPKTEEEKQQLFKWLEEKGISMQYLTVNSRSLQSLYKSCLESEGPDFEMPGVPPAKSFDKLQMRGK